MWLYPGYMYLVTIVITPICVLTLSSPEWVQWFVIFVIYALSYVARICQFTAVIVMISNGSFPDFRGMVNGIGQVMASLGRFIGPTIATNVYAWSLKHSYPWPFDFGCVFYLLGIMQLAHTLLIFYMDDSIDKGTPSIRRFVKMEMAKRGVEMVEVAKAEVAKETKVDEVVVPVEDKGAIGADGEHGVSAVNTASNAVNTDTKATNLDANAANPDANATNTEVNATNTDIDSNENAILSSPNLFPVS